MLKEKIINLILGLMLYKNILIGLNHYNILKIYKINWN